MDVNALVTLSKTPLIKQSSHTDRWPCKEGSERWTCASIQQDRMDGVISGEEPTSHSHKCLRDLFIGRAIELDSPSVELQDNLHDHTPHLIKPTCTKPRDPIQTARSTPPMSLEWPTCQPSRCCACRVRRRTYFIPIRTSPICMPSVERLGTDKKCEGIPSEV